MVFKSITLENFRPYYGTKTIEFCNGDKNITLIKAENGSGKTTLLEAIRWGLYGGELRLTGGDKKIGAQSFINKKYLDENSNKELSAKVRIELMGKDLSGENKENNYVIEREVFFRNNSYYKTKVSLEINGILSNGIEEGIDELIKRILPEEINFFIDGERLDTIAPEEIKGKAFKRNESSKMIRESIFRVLGIKSLENAVKDTSEVVADLKQKYLESNNISKEVLKLQNQEDEIAGNLERKLKKSVEIQKEHDILVEDLDLLYEELKQIPEKINKEKDLQIKLQELDLNIKKCQDNYSKLDINYKSFLSVKAIEVISENIVKNAFRLISKNKKTGEIPTKYAKEFLEELLSSKKCLCGNDLNEDTIAYNKIIEKIETATTKENRELFNECYYILKNTKKLDIKKEMKDYKIELLSILEKIDFFNNEKLSLLKLIGDKELVKKYSEINEEIRNKQEDLKKISIDKGILEREIEELRKDLDSKKKERISAEKKESKFNIEKDKKEFAEKILSHLEKIKSFKEDQGKEGLKKKIEEVYSKINKKGYTVELTENFEYKIYDIDNIEVGMSKGESKNKALSFIGGLIYYAKELNLNKGIDMFSQGGIYPLVLDAPYGDLDNEYRMEFTKMLPILSEQIIVMVSSGQWNEKIEEVIKERIGKIYILENQRRSSEEKSYDITDIKRG